MLRLEAFGELTIVRDDRRVVLAPPEAPALRGMLTLLACHGVGGVSRERARALLQRAESDGRDDDRWWESLMHELRSWLGERYLRIRPDHVALAPAATTADVVEFTEALARGERERAVQLHHARLVEGTHHCEAPAFDRWLQLQRESLASEAASAMEQLAEEASRRGEPLTAVRWWRKLAREYPLNHRIAASLMEALVQAGDREGALRHARFLEALAHERLALPGDEQVLAMAQALRADVGRTTVAVADPLERFRHAIAGRYRVEGEVGRGGHGSVLRAVDLRHERAVAIKVLHPDLSPALGATRFAREIRVVSALHHPNILPLYDSGAAAGACFFVMPLVSGASLRDRLRRDGALPVADALAIARQVAAALGEAHRHGIVHRDIKPENILLAGHSALVADFGIACAVEREGDSGLTAPGMVIGTPAYMSPEQGAPGQVVDGRADLYSLGCVLYEMLAGTPPFVAETAQALLAQHASAPVPALGTRRPDVPAAVEAVVMRALAKAPEDRFASSDELEGALAALLSPHPTAPLPSPEPAADRTRDRWPRRAHAALVVAVALLIAALLLRPAPSAPNSPHQPAGMRP